MEEKQLSEQESIAIITEMMGKVKSHYHESGINTILWGCVIAFCSLVSFAQAYWDFSIGFDIWILTLIAIVPFIWYSIKERKSRVVKTYQADAISAVWHVYMISIIAMIVYANVTYYTSPGLLKNLGLELFSKNIETGEVKPYRIFAPSFTSVLLALYAYPTLTTGIITKYKPLIVGAILGYGFFVVSLFTGFATDMLLSAGSAVSCWLIPGMLLRRKYLQQQKAPDV